MVSSKAFALSSLAVANAYQTRFFAETGGLQQSTFTEPIGMNYNLSDSQTLSYGSWWSSSYLHGNDDHDYLVLSHIIVAEAGGYYRGSILDITDPSVYNQWTTVVNGSQYLTNGSFHYDAGDYFMGSVTDDPLGPINTCSTKEGVSFNLTYELTSPVILNGGSGAIFWEDALLTNEWSVPACTTTGTVNVNGTTVEVVSESSFTWYDRQWQSGAASNWTWFELHLDSAPGYTGEKISNWFYPSGYGTEKGFATVRPQPGVNQVIATRKIDGNSSWTSEATGRTYTQDWTVQYADGMELNITSIRGDQEIRDDTNTYITYEGFVNVVGKRKNGELVTGYGLVEIEPVTS